MVSFGVYYPLTNLIIKECSFNGRIIQNEWAVFATIITVSVFKDCKCAVREKASAPGEL